MNKPNVILLTIDTLRADRLPGSVRPNSLTPHLDALAASGTRFDQAITGGSWTQAAFPVLLTSSYASMYGGCLGRLAPQRPSPVEALTRHGYQTAGFVTNPHLSRDMGYDRGFVHFTDLHPGETDPRLRRIKGGQRLLRIPFTHYVFGAMGHRLRPARLYTPADEVTATVCQWLDQAAKPFFAWVHYMDLHWPYHREESLTQPKAIAQAWQDLAIMNGGASFNGERTISPKERSRFIDLYERALVNLDAQIGRLQLCLESLEHAADTVIIAVSDHGEEFLDHGRWGHWESNLFDEVIRVPLIIRLPNASGGQVIRHQVRLLDLMPTILDLCGCDHADLMGDSLAPLLAGKDSPVANRTALCEMRRDPWHRIALRTEALKYIWDSKRPDQPEMYDLCADPGETHNVIHRFPGEARLFQAEVDVHLRRVAESEPATKAPEPELDDEVVRRLRDLGYLE